MRKFMAALSAAALVAVVPATPAMAEGSIVIQDGICYGFVPTPDGGIGTPLETTDSQVVVNGSWAKVTCHFDIPEGAEPAKATKSIGLNCGIPGYGDTNDSRMSASPGGRAVGTCRIRIAN